MQNVEIAPGITIGEWQSLDLSSTIFNENWKKAILIIEKRIKGRYLEPAQKLIESEESLPAKTRKFGFSIMAILSTLIEALQCFIEGKNDSNNKSKEIFIRFFEENEPFKSKIKIKHELIDKMYTHVRCGILHQAEITGGTRLRSVGPTAYEINGRLILNRSKMFNSIQEMFEIYLNNLKKNDEIGTKLRYNLKTKMEFIIKNAS